MPCSMHSHDLQHFCLLRPSCLVFQRQAPSGWPALIQKAHPSTSNTPHFGTYLRRIFVYILLIVSHGELAKQCSARAESSSIHFKYSALWDIFEKDLCLYTSYSHGKLARQSPPCCPLSPHCREL